MVPGEALNAPHLLNVELTQVLRRLEMAGTLSAARALQALEDLASLRISYHDHSDLLERVWSMRRNLTAYDALYIALAEALDAPLVTTDRGLGGAPRHGAHVIVVEQP